MCIFCDIAAKKIPSSTIYEDDNMLAILDLSQITKGHCLLIPKNHYDNILEMNEEELKNLLSPINKISSLLKDKLNCKGFNVLSNINEVAGQSVMHAHIHLIPRYSNDEIPINSNKPSGIDINEVYDEIMK